MLATAMKQLVRKLTKDVRVNLLIIITLALGLGVNTTVFSAVNGFLLEPLPFKDADHLIMIQETKLPEFPQFCSIGQFSGLPQAEHTTFESMGAFTGGRFNLLEGGKPESLSGLRSTASLSRTLGLKPGLGREFSEEEDHEGKSDVVIISHRLWVRRFNSDRNILTRRINIDRRLLAVIGVTSPNSEFPDLETDLWMPIAFGADDRSNHGGHNLGVIGRLKPNTSVQSAANDLKQIARQLETAYPDTNQGWSVLVTPVRQAFIGEIQTAILLLWGAVAFVLLIACANIANLLLTCSVSPPARPRHPVGARRLAFPDHP